MTRVPPLRMPRPSWPALIWLGALVIALVAATVLAVGSQARNTDVRTATELPATLSEPLAAEISPLWSADAVVDDQRVVASNTVITSTDHGVRGLDPLTGAERWRYLRPNATMCDLTVLDDVVVAIFRTTGRCNEAVALEAGTGVRRWYRNVGFSERLSLLGSGTAAVAVTPDGIAVIDAVGDSIRWRYNPPQGCEVASIGVGSSGVVVLEACTTGTTWLVEFDLYGGKQQWRVAPPPGDVTVIGADGAVSLLVEQQLMILSPRNGSVLSVVPVADSPDSADAPDAPDAAESAAAGFAGLSGGRGVALVYLADRLYAFEPSNGAQLWAVTATAPPAAGDLGLLVPEPEALVVRNPMTGAEISRSVVSGDRATEVLTRVERALSVLIAVTADGVVTYG